MGMFNVREPKRFEHKYIYYDERKDRLARIEEKAKRELGMIEESEDKYDPERIRGKFLDSTKHLKRRVESGGSSISTPMLVVAIAGLLLLLKYLITGTLFS